MISRLMLYTLSFFFTLHLTMPVYVNSSYISYLMGDVGVGIIYIISSILTVIGFFGISKTLKRAGDYQVTIRLLWIDALCLGVLSLAPHPAIAIIALMYHMLAVPIIYFNIDILLESYSSTEETGEIRGIYLTMANIAWIIAPILASILLGVGDSENFGRMYGMSALIVLPVIFIIWNTFKYFEDPPYRDITFGKAILQIIQNKNTRYIFYCGFLLQFFFAWMVIYMPIYLHDYIGFDWSEIGTMLAIALIPYIIVELPLGKLADTNWGEKEILSLGFIIVGLSTMAVGFIDNANYLLWLAVLIITRFGAAMIEIMVETYFFKITDAKDLEILTFFRTVRPFAYIAGPLIATAVLLFFSYQYLFIILGLILMYGLRFSLGIKDTR